MSTIQERVAAGAALLDKKVPGWREQVNLGTLKMNHCGRCVLGQIFGNYWGAVDDLGLSDSDEQSLGFYVAAPWSAAAEDLEYLELTAEWQRVLTGGEPS